MIQTLYFPEIDIQNFQDAFIDQRRTIIEGKRMLIQARQSGVAGAAEQAMAQAQVVYLQSAERFHFALEAVEQACAQIMRATIAPTVADAAQ